MEQTIREQQAAALAQTGGYYKHICWMALPLVCMSAYLYGPRPVLLCLVALLTTSATAWWRCSGGASTAQATGPTKVLRWSSPC